MLSLGVGCGIQRFGLKAKGLKRLRIKEVGCKDLQGLESIMKK